MKTTNSPLTKKSHIIVLITALSLLIAFGGYFYYKKEESSIRRQKYSELKAIADLKASQIEQWVQERISDAKVATQSTEGINEWLKDTANVKLKQDIIKQLQPFQKELGYENIFLAAPNGRLLLSAQAENREFDSFLLQKIIEASEKKEILLTDFYMSQTHNKIHYDIISPIIDNRKNTIAVLLFRRDPNTFLYPLIQTWPTPSPSSETSILRVEQDSVVFLNELRHRKNTALQFKIPLTRTDVPAVQAALGRTGLYEGIDYRGVEVLSDIRVIPATNWIMLAKVDKSEIFSGLYVSAAVISGFTFLLIIICGIGLVFIYNSRQKNIFKELYNKEKELWQHQERFRVTMESLGEGIITTDLSGKLQYLNSRAEALTGWNLREARGRMLSEIYHVKNEETGQIENNILDKVIKHGIVKELANHTILITKSGKEIPVMDTGAPIFNTDGSVNGIVITFHDEAEKRTQQKLIKDNEEKYRFLSAQFEAILDHVPGLVFYKDTRNNFIRVNRYFAEANKTTKEAFENKNCADIYPKEDAEKYYEDDLSVINSGVAKLNIEERWLTETGARWVNTNKIPFVDNDGIIIGVIGLSFDITERKQTEEKVHASEVRYRRLFESAKDGILILDAETGMIIDVNPFLIGLLGFSHEAFLGKKVWELGFLRDIIANRDNFAELQQKEYVRYEDLPLETSDGRQIDVEFVSNVYLVNNKKVIQCNIRDITERLFAEERQASLSRILEESLNEIFIFSVDDLKFIEANKGARNNTGYSIEEFRQMTPVDLKPDFTLNKFNEQILPLRTGEQEKIVFETFHRRKNGSDYQVEIHLQCSTYDNKPVYVATILDVTERKQAEKEMSIEQKKSQQYFQFAGTMMVILDQDGKISKINIKACNILGYTEEEILGRDWFSTILPKDIGENVRAIFKEIMNGKNEAVEFYENPIINRSGKERLIEWHNVLLLDDNGKPVGTLSSGEDITERKLTGAIIHEQTQDLQLINSLNVAINRGDKFANIIEMLSKEIMRNFNCFGTITSFPGADNKVLIPHNIQFPSQLLSRLEKLTGGNLHSLPLKISLSGEGYLARIMKSGLPHAFNDEQEIKAVMAEFTDNSLLKKLAPSVYDMLSFRSMVIIPLISGDAVLGMLEIARSIPTSKRELERLGTIAGQLTLAIGRKLHEEKINNINAYLEIKVEERTRQLKEARAEADRANLAKSEFLSRMSHELRTPMNSILGFTQLMNMGELTPAHKKGVDHILNSGKHLLNLINEVLDLSRIEAGKLTLSLEPVQLSGIVAETLDVIKPLAAAKNITFNFPESSVCALFVKADRVKIKQVLLNLVSNSVKYNRDGGSVKVECKSVGSRQLAVGSQEPEVGSRESEVGSQQSEVGSREPEAETLRISVVDTGVGIAPEEIENLFIPFKRIGAEISEIEGTGLGLTVAKKLIEAMGGTIGVESEPGKGSTFWVELPQATGQTERQGSLNDLSAPEKEKAVMTGTILYIEDNLSNIHLVAQILEEHRPGIKLISETHGRNTVKLATDYKPALILLDLDLPDIHGSEVLKRLQENKLAKLIPVVILSADAMGHQMERLIKAGAKAYITKPLDIVDFLKIVDGYFGKKPEVGSRQ
jgi:PAS domain S-box-containing protein